jgi:hypothetical protein
MKKKEEGGMKSALELAMEKVDSRGGKRRNLTDDQKHRLQEIESGVAAGIAEVEIMAKQRVEEARAAGDMERLEELQEQTVRETARLRREAERKKDKIRAEKG